MNMRYKIIVAGLAIFLLSGCGHVTPKASVEQFTKQTPQQPVEHMEFALAQAFALQVFKEIITRYRWPIPNQEECFGAIQVAFMYRHDLSGPPCFDDAYSKFDAYVPRSGDTIVRLTKGILFGRRPGFFIEEAPSIHLSESGKLAFIKIERFYRTTEGDIYEMLLAHPEVTKIIFDLRGSIGGFTKNAIELARLFLPEDAVVYTATDKHGKVTTFFACDDSLSASEKSKCGIFAGRVIVLLVNEGTASASEMFAGAVQSAAQAYNLPHGLIGSPTDGKRAIQHVTYVVGSSSALVLSTHSFTIGKYEVANVGERMQRIIPDVIVKPSEYFQSIERGAYATPADNVYIAAISWFNTQVIARLSMR